MSEDVTISHRGASYQLGRGPRFYGIWPAGSTDSPPLEWWPETDDGWSAAWLRFSQLEVPGAVTHVGAAPAAGFAPAATFGTAAASRPGRPAAGAIVAAALLGVGLLIGIVGLFPAYFGGTSLASESSELVPHLIYLAGWAAAAVLVVLGGGRQRAGALLGIGLSAVTLGLFLADIGTVAAGTSGGAGLVLSSAGWLLCAAGSVVALRLRTTGRQAWAREPRQWVPTVTMMLAAVGAAIAFAPSWDRYVLHTATGFSQTTTAGNAFANPGPVITGDVAVMVAVVAVAVVAGLWRPARYGAALLAGAVIPLAAQAISAIVEVVQGTPPAQFGVTPGQAAQLGLTIQSSLTLAFWVYCAFLVALLLSCAIMTSPLDATAPQPPVPAIPRPADAPGSAVSAS
ncbi:MAG TPA: hypothetical protein VLX31_02155 [Streptosporangiaceae bacterium]|nr:hypothetical protein [Streptosporangiaceae bacterium]